MNVYIEYFLNLKTNIPWIQSTLYSIIYN